MRYDQIPLLRASPRNSPFDFLEHEGRFDLVVADPPYAETALDRDGRVACRERVARRLLAPTGSPWLSGSLRSLMEGASAL